ncbi:TIGR04283 family arsenosugar biosynthesis glycosyltransferase [Mariniflexile sp.]|uniref:TIGR04283 family arsenosugar biosynthesis glycosyltransferase n=1 Tax=Mariniflexile sp. TaxID=1979402 RepID=UPI003563E6A9
MTKISIIIPILNEAESIVNLLKYLLQNSSKENISEIIVVDGGSTDGSMEIIENFVSNRVQSSTKHKHTTSPKETAIACIRSKKGRAKQMNFGAKNASGNILYFLHADSFPPKNFDQFILEETNQGHEAGCFIMKFNSNHCWLKLAGFLTRLPWRACRGGDQSLFISKSLFNSIGGFDETFKIYEDNIIIGKLYKLKKFVVIQKWLTTSARRYKTNGVWTLQYHFIIIHLKKYFGTSAEHLSSYYKKHIK